ncbi:MAG: 3-hydroxyacyl-CoA dehydrogenase family protein [Oscillospiraceae bacterium]|nr:3-hydroxyacyl-CoA dehydrogenase family protein [Oscillospiraceae bacterium]
MEIKKIGVVGAGLMGAGIAQIAASCKYKVILRDVNLEFCEKATAKMKSGLDKRIADGKTTKEKVEETLGNIITTEKVGDLKDCDMIIEAAFERMDVKQGVFRELSGVCRDDCVFCTNTSSLPITDIMSGIVNPGRGIGMHFFFPVTAMKLVEVIRGEKTSDDTVKAVFEVASGMGKTAVECKTDTPGFIVNRCLFAFMLEAVRCYEAGVASAEDIDTAVKLGLNHPLGPFEMMDLSGLDSFPHVCESLSSLPVTDWSTPKSVEKLIEQGDLGRKTGRGWHDYKAGK